MKTIKLYSYFIIKPLEKKIQNLRRRVYGKNIILTKKIEEAHLIKMEKLLFECYEKLSILIDEEIKYNSKKH